MHDNAVNGIGKREAAAFHDTDIVHEGIDLLVHIESAAAAGNLRYRKHLVPVKASFLEILRDCHNIVDFPIEYAVLDNGRIVGKIHQRMVLAEIIGKPSGKFTAVLVDNGNIQADLFKFGFISSCGLLDRNGDGQKDDKIQDHHMDISSGNRKESSIYCHNVPSLCLKMQL